MRLIIVFFGCMLLIVSCIDTSEKEKVSYEWEDLIEDSQLSGWSKKGAIESNYENGVLTLNGTDDSWLIFHKSYEDFIFQTDFLLKDENSAGIAFRYNEQKKGDPEYNGYKVNLDHNKDQQNPIGSIHNVARAKWLKSTKSDQWNKINIITSGDHIRVMINDTLVVESHNRRIEEGLIGLGVGAGSTIQFRNMQIKEMEEPDISQPLIEDYMRSYSKKPLEPMIQKNQLSDWRQVGEASWDINDGVIHGYSNEKGGFLVYKDSYRNFYLKLKFKIKHEDNSGIFIRHNPAEADLISTDNAIECNIYDHDGYLHEYSTGSIAPIARSWSKMIDYNDWNDMEIFAFEDQICMYVNGIKSSEAHLPQKFNQKGEICIQGGIQVFNGNLRSDIYIKDMYVKDFEEIPFLGF